MEKKLKCKCSECSEPEKEIEIKVDSFEIGDNIKCKCGHYFIQSEKVRII